MYRASEWLYCLHNQRHRHNYCIVECRPVISVYEWVLAVGDWQKQDTRCGESASMVKAGASEKMAAKKLQSGASPNLLITLRLTSYCFVCKVS